MDIIIEVLHQVALYITNDALDKR